MLNSHGVTWKPAIIVAVCVDPSLSATSAPFGLPSFTHSQVNWFHAHCSTKTSLQRRLRLIIFYIHYLSSYCTRLISKHMIKNILYKSSSHSRSQSLPHVIWNMSRLLIKLKSTMFSCICTHTLTHTYTHIRCTRNKTLAADTFLHTLWISRPAFPPTLIQRFVYML